MNECVKTGAIFLDAESGRTYVGDLFYPWQIKGIPAHQGIPIEVGRPIIAHIVVRGIEYFKRARSEYVDTNVGITVEAANPEFLAYIREWYPEISSEFAQ